MTEAGVSVVDEYGDLVTIPFKKVLYLKKAKKISSSLPQRLVGFTDAIGIIFDDPMGRVVWVTDKDAIARVTVYFDSWLKEGA